MKVYICGPITGRPDLNRQAFREACIVVRLDDGCFPVNPHEIGRQLRQLVAAGGAEPTWSDYMRADIAALVRCDAILLLPGWSDSRGATLEQNIASVLGIDRYEGSADA